MIKVNAIGEACPIPVVKTINAVKELNGPGMVEVLVDNDIAVQNLTRMANHNGYEVKAEKLEEKKYQVTITVGEAADPKESKASEAEVSCEPDRKSNKVVVISSNTMGTGDEELGGILLKGFIFALTQQEELPSTMLFYNGGAKVTCENSPSIDDLKSLEAQGVEILTCGTCLNFYGLTEKLQVGGVTNMYDIVETQLHADLIVKP